MNHPDPPLPRFVPRRGHTPPITFPEIFQLPTVVDLITAGRAFGVGRNTAYRLVHRDAYPCEVLRLGRRYKVPTAKLLAALGIDPIPVHLDDLETGATFATHLAS
ncbi:DNA-binding protein [Actinomadura rupiterrae]|uniref:DNA-binding protein n=1 Tax=Actinomadura rupiterrae TaxID=559627 RepID=UPI0020A37E94|nr:DNA-binding protein [Actinomadura rupiterrae]MCP2339540.1 hypothetical protein [Actinomadura rupiterrae]